MKAHVKNNSGHIEWYTPKEIIEAARKVLGTIDLDPASCAEANEIVKATRFYSIENDGLAKKWEGKIWLNPPFATGMIETFVDKAIESYRAGDVEEAIIFLNNATDTTWFQSLFNITSAICFIRGRIRCWRPDKLQNSTPLQGQALIYLGSCPEVFQSVFGSLGAILQRANCHRIVTELFNNPIGRPMLFDRPMSAAERKRRSRMMKKAQTA